MKYTVTKSIIRVIGPIWMPYGAVCAMDYELDSYKLGNLLANVEEGEELSREHVEHWLSLNSGDFQGITDFHADLELPDGTNFTSEWESEDNECTYMDCMHGGDE